MKLKGVVVALGLAMALMATRPAYALTSKDIQKELMCQCGCTMVVDVCDCDTANQIRAKIDELMGQGQNKSEIIGYFVGRYGEKMLSSPPKKGFNLVAWIVPFAAVVVGGTALFFVLKAWARKGRGKLEEVTVAQPVSAEESAEYRERLELELKKFNEEGPA